MRRMMFGPLLLALASSACGSSTTTTPTPTPDPIIDRYPDGLGTLEPNGAWTFSFVTGISGSVKAQVEALDPSDALIGLALGVYNQSAATCQVALSNDRATLSTLIEGYSDRAGTLCVRVYDTGILTAPVSFSIAVQHQ